MIDIGEHTFSITRAKQRPKVIVRPCPWCFAPLSKELVCKSHGQMESCPKCKQVKKGDACGCKVVVKTPQAGQAGQAGPVGVPTKGVKRDKRVRRSGVGKGAPGHVREGRAKYTPPQKECLFCGTMSTRKYCEDHRKWYQMVRYWMGARNMTELEAVAFIKRNEEANAQTSQKCAECGRPAIILQPHTMLCRKCVIRANVNPKGRCISCGANLFATGAQFCKATFCSRLSIRFSYYRRTGKTDEQIFKIIAPALERVRNGEAP